MNLLFSSYLRQIHANRMYTIIQIYMWTPKKKCILSDANNPLTWIYTAEKSVFYTLYTQVRADKLYCGFHNEK